MPRILDYNGREAVRTVTVADIVGTQGAGPTARAGHGRHGRRGRRG